MLPIFDAYIRQQRNRIADRNLRLQRYQLRVNSDPFSLPDLRFVELFRLNKELVRNLIVSLRPHLNAPRYRSGISIETKIFTALRFYATGCYQRAVGEDYHLGLSQTAVHRCIHEVTDAIDENLTDVYISFPNTREHLNRIREEFMHRFNFPGVIGAVDGTHIAILKPAVEEHNFINRKGYHSLNVQLICDANLKILNVNANFGGSSHDSFIWRQSQVKQHLHNMYLRGQRGHWLIGDSGYPLEPYVITPFDAPGEGTPEAEFNQRHASARNCIERCIGLLKTRFRCMLKERTARYAPQFVGRLLNTCAVLHNICINNNIQYVGDNIAEDMDIIGNDNAIVPVVHNLLNEGQNVRQNIVIRYMN